MTGSLRPAGNARTCLHCPHFCPRQHTAPDDKLQAFQHTIFTQDQPMLGSQTPQCLPLDPHAELHTAADKASSAYRRFLRHSGITFGVC